MPIRRQYILFNGPQWLEFGEKKMFTSSNRTSRLAGLMFAAVMAVAIHSSVLMTFDNLATDAYVAQSILPPNVAVLETVTIVGQRI